MTKAKETRRHTPDLRAELTETGHVIVKGLFSAEEIAALRRVVYLVYRKFEQDEAAFEGVAKPWDSSILDQRMIALRSRDRDLFAALYDTVQNSPILFRFLTSPKAQSVVADILGAKVEDLSCSGVMLRMDGPQDARNALEWHQDHSYYRQNRDGGLGLVMSVALQDTDEEIGALKICPKSHVEGLIELDVEAKSVWGTSLQRAVPMKRVDRYSQLDAVTQSGDALLLHMDTFHRSGNNTSNRIRFSALCRYHLMTADDYVPHRLRHEFNEFMLKRIYGGRS